MGGKEFFEKILKIFLGEASADDTSANQQVGAAFHVQKTFGSFRRKRPTGAVIIRLARQRGLAPPPSGAPLEVNRFKRLEHR